MGSGLSGPHAQPAAEDRLQAGHPRRELLRHRLRGVPQRLLRRRLRRLRRRDGHRRREAQGLRLLRPRRSRAGQRRHVGRRSPRRRRSRLLAPAYAKKYGVDDDEMKDVLTRIAWKNHNNGALNPRAQFRKEVSEGDHRLQSPIVAGPLGIFDCSGVSRRLGRGDHRAGRGRPQVHRQPALREGAVVRRRPGRRPDRPDVRLHDVPRGRALGRGRLPAGRHHRPARRARAWPRCTTASRRPSWC